MASLRSFEELATTLGGYRGIVVALDPGETTGYAVFRNFRLVSAGQFPSGHLSLAWNNMVLLISGIRGVPFGGWCVEPGAKILRAPEGNVNEGSPSSERPLGQSHENQHASPLYANPPHFVIEDYRVYSFKLDTHKFSDVFTIKVLTTYELLATLIGSPTKLTLAQAAKTFCTDKKLEQWGFWLPAMRHARDAIRHATYYIVADALARQDKGTKPTFQI